jgi:diguanylate cyclase (GGDEF)-like protein/PAS domain S-box-containing protein
MATGSEPLRVLLVEDDEDDYLLTSEMLAGAERAQFELEWCRDFQQALAAIQEQRHDVYLIDYRLGAHTGLDLVRAGFSSRPLAPILMLTGETAYEIDLEATALGVTDYLLKHELTPATLERSIRYAVSNATTLHALSESQERYELAVHAASDGIWDWDLLGDRIYFSPRWHAILGRPEQTDDADPVGWFNLVHHDDVVRLRAAIDAHLDGRSSHLEVEHRMRHTDGSWRWVLTRGLAIRGPDGRVTRMAGSLSDITERRAAERQLQHDALHDALTGLPNRALFMDRVEHALRRVAREKGLNCAVLFLDIDRFKLINDSFSHAVGDRLLVALGQRMSGVLRPSDTVSRFGGDEFTLLLDGVSATDHALAIAGRLQDAVARPFTIDGHQLSVSATVGVAVNSPGISAADMVRNADIAMYEARRRGREDAALFDEGMHRRVVDRLAHEHDLRRAVEGGLLEVHYQPIVDLTTQDVRGLEALARWPGGWPPVSPVEFIAIAEETGLIGTLGLHVLRTALSALAGWRAANKLASDTRISVNISGRQLSDQAFPQHVRAAVVEAGVPGDALRLEVTESSLMQDCERTRAIIAAVYDTGAGLHLDDFGTGYSSLTALRQFPVDALKIDRSFVSSLGGHDGGSEAIVRSTVALAHSLGLKVIAEGVETEEQADRLRELRCDYGQGFLFSKPLNAERTNDLLDRWPAAHLADSAASG